MKNTQESTLSRWRKRHEMILLRQKKRGSLDMFWRFFNIPSSLRAAANIIQIFPPQRKQIGYLSLEKNNFVR